MAECLEGRVLMSASPYGFVDTLNKTAISGWAYDAQDKSLGVTIDVVVDGTTTSLATTVRRDDVAALVGSRYHGFYYVMPALSPGAHAVEVYARDSDGNKTLLRSASLNNPAPVGHIDVMNSTTVSGWVLDTDNSTAALEYRVDVNGVEGQVRTANLSRPDLVPFYGSANHGFSFTVVGTQVQTVKVMDVYVKDAPSNQWVLMGSNNRLPVGYVDTMTSRKVTGWVHDADLGSSPVLVRVDVNGIEGTPVEATLSRPDLVPVVGSANHGYSIDLPELTPGQHTVKVWAIDPGSSSAKPKLLGEGTVVNAVPTGHVDVINDKMIAGWAFDADVGSGPINVTVYVDDTQFATVPANLARTDLTAVLGSPNHGFYVDLSSLPKTSHAITLTLHDDRNSVQKEIVLYDGFINNTEPRGWVDSATSRRVSGWAQDPDAGASAIAVDVYVNGKFAGSTTANLNRPDLTAVLGSANHGFNFELPNLAVGTHTVEVYAAESQGTVATLIGKRTVTNTAPTGWVDVLNKTTVAGWAYDKDAGTGPVNVAVYINGTLSATVTANVSRPDLAGVLGSSNHGFVFTVPTLSAGSHQISVFVLDAASGKLVPLGNKIITV